MPLDYLSGDLEIKLYWQQLTSVKKRCDLLQHRFFIQLKSTINKIFTSTNVRIWAISTQGTTLLSKSLLVYIHCIVVLTKKAIPPDKWLAVKKENQFKLETISCGKLQILNSWFQNMSVLKAETRKWEKIYSYLWWNQGRSKGLVAQAQSDFCFPLPYNMSFFVNVSWAQNHRKTT